MTEESKAFPIHVLHNTDKRFELIWHIEPPPETLYVQGSEQALLLLDKLPQLGFAIVGTRYPLARSVQQLNTWLKELSGFDLVIVSGFAYGIDSAAHAAAIANGLPTIAILGTGLNIRYPSGNDNLRQSILNSNGLIISEYPPDTPAFKSNFIARNRLIAGLTKAVLIAEASYKSGALNTARWAREMNKSCFAVPCIPGDQTLAGNQLLLEKNQAKCFWGIGSLEEVWLELMSWRDTKRLKNTSTQMCFNTDQNLLISHIQKETTLKGGAHVLELLDWASAQGWLPKQFFVTLKTSLEAGLISDRNGTLSSSPSSSRSCVGDG